MKEVPLGGEKAAGRVALIDDEDYDLISSYRWRVWERPRSDRRIACGPYAVTGGPGSFVQMHKLLTGWPMTDHIDRDGLNNQRSNLRPATNAQNQRNRGPNAGGSSRYKGVWRAPCHGKWRAEIRADGKRRYLGYFASEEEAALVYNAAATELFGEFAWLNEVAS